MTDSPKALSLTGIAIEATDAIAQQLSGMRTPAATFFKHYTKWWDNVPTHITDMTLCEDHCVTGCKSYQVPMGHCFNP